MVAPVTGPFVAYPSEPFADLYRKWYRQKPPYTLPLEFRYYRYYGFYRYSGKYGSGSGKQADLGSNSFSKRTQAQNQAYSVAYDRLRSKVNDKAGWAENFAQINKTRESLVGRCVQLANFTKALRRGDFVRAARTLRTPVPSRVSNRKAVSQNFLEYEYGIKPLISDIQSSWSILTSDPDWKLVKGRGRSTVSENWSSYSSGSGTIVSIIDTPSAFVDVSCQCYVRVVNPNLYLANQLGILDVALPWKLIPFSFIVDWFVNVEQVLSSVTDWYGLAVDRPHRTVFWKGSDVRTYSRSGSSDYLYSTLNRNFCEVDRYLDIPSPNLVIKAFKGFSVERGAQAIALVLSVLGK